MNYFTSKKVELSFDQAIAKVTEILKEEGFGVLTEIDVKDTLKKNWMWTSKNTESWALATQALLIRHCRRRTKLA